MCRVITDHRLPGLAYFDLQLNDKLYHPSRLGPMVMPDSRIGPYRKRVDGFRQGVDLGSQGEQRTRFYGICGHGGKDRETKERQRDRVRGRNKAVNRARVGIACTF